MLMVVAWKVTEMWFRYGCDTDYPGLGIIGG